MHSNCQPDQSPAILKSIHDFITEYKNKPIESVDPGAESNDVESDYLVEFDSSSAHLEEMETVCLNVQSPASGNEMAEYESISEVSSRIFRKLFKGTKCHECTGNFELMDEREAILSVPRIRATNLYGGFFEKETLAPLSRCR